MLGESARQESESIRGRTKNGAMLSVPIAAPLVLQKAPGLGAMAQKRHGERIEYLLLNAHHVQSCFESSLNMNSREQNSEDCPSFASHNISIGYRMNRSPHCSFDQSRTESSPPSMEHQDSELMHTSIDPRHCLAYCVGIYIYSIYIV